MGDQYNVQAAGAVGPNAQASDFSINQAGAEPGSSPLDLTRLEQELETLRVALKQQAVTVEQDAVVAAVGQAKLAAAEGDEAATLSHLKRAGHWAGGAATAIGAGVAAGAIRAALGI